MTNGSALSGRPHIRAMWENRREQVAMARPTARPSTAAPPRATLDDHELARLAIAGDGDAFAQLYDRHERRVYGYCLRMLGAPDDAADATQETFVRLLRRLPALEGRDVNFIAYALTTARNACYDAIEARRRVQPVAEPIDRSAPTTRAPIGLYAGEPGGISLDPERAALLAATRKDVRAANARLPERQREVLALRELEQLSYEQIGEIVHLNENAVAQLISRARIRLREEIRGDALASIAASSPDCERALALLARLQDTQRSDAEALGWLGTHMDSCETCRLSRVAMEEVGVSYRALGPIVVLAWLRHATIAHAARFVGADWSHIADSVPRTTPSSTSPADASSDARYADPGCRPRGCQRIDASRDEADGNGGTDCEWWEADPRASSQVGPWSRCPVPDSRRGPGWERRTRQPRAATTGDLGAELHARVAWQRTPADSREEAHSQGKPLREPVTRQRARRDACHPRQRQSIEHPDSGGSPYPPGDSPPIHPSSELLPGHAHERCPGTAAVGHHADRDHADRDHARAESSEQRVHRERLGRRRNAYDAHGNAHHAWWANRHRVPQWRGNRTWLRACHRLLSTDGWPGAGSPVCGAGDRQPRLSPAANAAVQARPGRSSRCARGSGSASSARPRCRRRRPRSSRPGGWRSA